MFKYFNALSEYDRFNAFLISAIVVTFLVFTGIVACFDVAKSIVACDNCEFCCVEATE